MGRQKRKEYAFYAVLAGTFLLIAGAYGSGEKSVQQNAKEMGAVAEKAVAEPEYVPAVRLYAGIFTKLDGEEYAVIEKNKDILVAAANRGYFDESHPTDPIYSSGSILPLLSEMAFPSSSTLPLIAFADCEFFSTCSETPATVAVSSSTTAA